MKKTLRFALVAFFSAIALGASAQTTIWEEDWQSSEAGKLVNEVTNANAVYTLSSSNENPYTKLWVNANDESNLELLIPKKDRNESWTATIDLKGNSGNLTLSYTYNKSTISITSETAGVTISDVSSTGALINVPSGTSSLKLTFSNPMSQNARFDNIKLVTGGSAQEYPEVANIAALKALESGTKAKLTFTNVQVNFTSGNDMYVQDATGAIDIYNCGLSYTAGQKLNGTAVVEYKLYNGMPEITSVSNAELTATDGTATPTEPALDAIDNSLLCHLVKATGTVYIENNEETGKTNYFLEDEDNNSVLFYRKWSSLEGTDLSGLKDGDVATVTGIVVLSNNTPAIGVTEIEYEGGGSQETITAANIAAFKALEDGTVAELTLTDAVVTFVNGKDMYVTDATGSIDFYNCNLSYTAGQKLNGKIKVKYTVYKSTPEAIEPSENNLTATDGEATPQEVAVSSVDISKVCDYVKISGKVKVLEETSGDKTFTNYYIADESDNKVMIYRKWKSLDGTDVTTLNDGDEATITGIVVPFNDTVEIAVTAMESTSSGIENINAEIANDAPIFNIAGQRVEKAVKGIYIQNGKKFIVK
ncbi:MAG: hypothetical protein IKH08_01655 [Prevotella sp.]|nr:hypothetical protein [Prevotella sp.]